MPTCLAARRLALPILTLPILTYAGAALAADLDLASRIDRVTVYPDAAVVTRVAPLDLPAGPSTLMVKGLPSGIDPASLRVEGEGSATFLIGAVDVRAVPGEAQPAVDADLERRLKGLREERDKIAGQVAALQGKKSAIQRYAKAGPEKLSAESAPLEVSQWASAWDAIGNGLASVNEDLRVAQDQAQDLDAEITALERARPRTTRPGAPKRDVAISVEPAQALKGELRLSYRIAGAGWTPLYDARLDTGAKDRAPALDLVRRASVKQRTGEDWSDVTLSVSTTRVNRGAAAPELPALQAQFEEPIEIVVPAPMEARPAPMPRAQRQRLQQEPAADQAAPKPVAAEQQQAVLDAGTFQASFTVPGRVSVGTDGAQKSFVLSERRASPTLLVKAVPVLDETAYLQASFTHDEDAPLLPGEVSVQRDGTFVGRVRLPLKAPGETVDLGFGADDRVRITRVPVRRRENEPGFLTHSKTDQREFKTTVRNLHPQPIRITVQDRIPFSENSAIVIEQVKQTTTPPTEPQAKDPRIDQRGVLAWTYDYAPGETREIRLTYRMRWPADRDVIFQPRPAGEATQGR